MAPEAVGDEVLDAIAAVRDALASAPDLAAVELPLAQLAEMLLEPREAIGAQGGGPIDVAQSPGRGGLGSAEDHSALELFGPDREPGARALRTLPQLFPLCELDDRPLHDPVVVDAGPRRASAARTRRR
jgi:hypothetical protein